MAGTNFLSLPGELRNVIYALVFTTKELTTLPCCKDWPDACTKYLSLFLTSRQIYHESSSLPWGDYAHSIVLSFYSSKDVRIFASDALERWPGLRTAEYRLRILVPNARLRDLATVPNRLIDARKLPCPPITNPRKQISDLRAKILAMRLWAQLFDKGRDFHTVKHEYCGIDGICNSTSGGFASRTTGTYSWNGRRLKLFAWHRWLKADDHDGPSHNLIVTECMVIGGWLGDVRLSETSLDGDVDDGRSLDALTVACTRDFRLCDTTK